MSPRALLDIAKVILFYAKIYFLDALASHAFKLSLSEWVSQSVTDTFFLRSPVYTVFTVYTVSSVSTVLHFVQVLQALQDLQVL